MDEIIFDQYRDPFRAFNIHMSIICDLEQGGKITEEEAFKQIKDLYKQFKYYYKHTVKLILVFHPKFPNLYLKLENMFYIDNLNLNDLGNFYLHEDYLIR